MVFSDVLAVCERKHKNKDGGIRVHQAEALWVGALVITSEKALVCDASPSLLI